jgi:hypothetical protein
MEEQRERTKAIEKTSGITAVIPDERMRDPESRDRSSNAEFE